MSINNYFLQSNIDILLYIGIPVLVLILIAIGFFLYNKISTKRKKKEGNALCQQIICYLGEKDNIDILNAKGSRLVVVLKDKSLLKEEELKNIGVTSIVKMSSKITLVIGSIAADVEEYFNSK